VRLAAFSWGESRDSASIRSGSADPPVLEPTRSDEHGDYYEIEARESTATILRGKRTTIRGYNGIFPGPNIVWSYLFAVVDEGAF
jgi:hypothetical protein